MFFDWTYIVILMPALLLSLWASAKVSSAFARYSKLNSARNISGAQAARMVLDAKGIREVKIEKVSGRLTDHYDPSAKVIRLSEAVYDSSSAAAIGVACHEAGHAIQYASAYAPIRIRSALIPITTFGARVSVPLILMGFLLSSFSYSYVYLIYIGILCFALSTFFQLITLPVEFNASKRALHAIEERSILSGEELQGARKVLNAAAMTYVAALAVSLTQLLRFILLANQRRRY